MTIIAKQALLGNQFMITYDYFVSGNKVSFLDNGNLVGMSAQRTFRTELSESLNGGHKLVFIHLSLGFCVQDPPHQKTSGTRWENYLQNFLSSRDRAVTSTETRQG